MALTLGKICAEEPTLVRVHNMDPLRDLLLVKQPGRWSLRAAMIAVAEAGTGGAVAGRTRWMAMYCWRIFRETADAAPGEKPTTYSIVGAGSQILRDLGVRKMRLMSSPMKFKCISGFDLEVVEYVPAE